MCGTKRNESEFGGLCAHPFPKFTQGSPGLTSTSEYIFKVKMFSNDLIFLQKFWVPSVHLLQGLTESFFGLARKGACVFGDVNEIGKKKKKKETA